MNNEQDTPDAGLIGLKDRIYEGWLNAETGELSPDLLIGATDTVVDVGCGDGAYINFCAKRGASVIFVDQDEERISAAEDRVKSSGATRYRGIVSDCDPIPLDDGTADVVVCTEVLEHVPDPSVFLRELIRIAKPGAKMLLTVPDARSEQFVKATAPPQYFEVPNHIRVFDSDQFEELVTGGGLDILRHDYMGCFWSIYWPLAWLVCEPGSPGLPMNHPHPITTHFAKCWKELQEHPEGHVIRNALNQLLPKSQSILAVKPGG